MRHEVGAAHIRWEEAIMSLIQVELMNEIFTPVQQKEIISQLTDAVISIKGESMRSASWVRMEEICNGEWRIG
jgi:4-oxalocrotonate tautomerase